MTKPNKLSPLKQPNKSVAKSTSTSENNKFFKYCTKSTVKGETCKNQSVNGSFCKLHSTQKKESCDKLTSKGKSCLNPKDTCVYHSNYKGREKKQSSKLYCSADTKNGLGCKNVCKNGGDYCSVHSRKKSQMCGMPTSKGQLCKHLKDSCPNHERPRVNIKSKKQEQECESESDQEDNNQPIYSDESESDDE